MVIAFSDSARQIVTVSTTLTKPDNTTKLAGQFRVCEAEDEELTAITGQVSDEGDSLLIHCLFRKELFSLYALLKVTID